jgi:hypothetical protein
MPMSRGQMSRELYNIGSSMPSVNGRERFGLGSFIKKTVRKIIPNEIAEVATKAAPFVAPFNPLLAAGMAGIGGFDQTGSISKSLKSGLLTYGGGQAARYLGGAGFQKGINPFAGADFSGGLMSGIRSLGSSPIGTETGFGKMFAKTPTQEITTVSGGDYGQFVEPPFGSGDALGGEMLTSKPLETATQQITKQGTQGYTDLFKQVLGGDLQQKTQALKDLGGKALKDIYTKPIPGSPGETQIDKLAIGATIAGATSYIEAKKLAEEAELVDDADEYTEEMYEADKARYTDYYSQILTPEAFGLKDGGRVNYSIGSPEPDEDMRNDKDIGIPSIMLDETTDQPEDMESILNDKLSYYIPGFSSKDLSRLYRVLGKEGGKNVDFKNLHKVLSNPDDYPDAIIEIKQMLGIPENKKDGGIIGVRNKYAMGSEVPIRENQAGIKEMDFRETGGFVPPIGVKERADDIPAMLSNNEFVFTADAVRAAGGGSVNKGAQRMYNMMKSLEGKVV